MWRAAHTAHSIPFTGKIDGRARGLVNENLSAVSPCNRVVNYVKPRKNAMQNGPEDRFIYRPRYRDRKRCTKADSGSNDSALVHIFASVGHNGLLAISLSDRRSWRTVEKLSPLS